MREHRGPRLTALRTPANPTLTSQLEEDPRGFRPGFDPAGQTDEMILAQLLQDIRHRGIRDIGQYLDFISAENLPPQLAQVTFRASITAANTPVKLMPKSARRMGIYVINFTAAGQILFSFDYPTNFGNNAGGQIPVLGGVPIAASNYFEESNGTASINDIWVFTNDPASALTYPIPVLGYQGGLSLVGNRRP
jgi:hypothetical protein